MAPVTSAPGILARAHASMRAVHTTRLGAVPLFCICCSTFHAPATSAPPPMPSLAFAHASNRAPQVRTSAATPSSRMSLSARKASTRRAPPRGPSVALAQPLMMTLNTNVVGVMPAHRIWFMTAHADRTRSPVFAALAHASASWFHALASASTPMSRICCMTARAAATSAPPPGPARDLE